MPVFQAEHFCRSLCLFVLSDANNFAFAKMISAAVRAELRHLFAEVTHVFFFQDTFEPTFQRFGRTIMSIVDGIFTPLRPIEGNSELFADRFRCTLNDCLSWQSFIELFAFFNASLSFPCTGGK